VVKPLADQNEQTWHRLACAVKTEGKTVLCVAPNSGKNVQLSGDSASESTNQRKDNCQTPLCNFNGHKRNMHQWHLTAETTELRALTSLVRPTGVINSSSHAYTFCALSGHISCVFLSVGKLQTQVMAISFLDLLEFIANVCY